MQLQNKIKTLITLAIVVLTPSMLWAGYAGDWVGSPSGSAPWTVTSNSGGTISCAYADVSAAVSNATAEDTIYVGWDGVTPEICNATWDSQLVITKGLQIIGAGKSSGTTITCNYNGGTNYSGTSPYLIVYAPDATNRTNNTPFRLSGFYLDGDSKAQILTIYNQSVTAISNIRVDNNYFINPQHWVIFPQGTIYGVIDNNTFNANGKTTDFIDSYGMGNNAWHYLTYSHGSADNLYYEDNLFLAATGFLGDNWDCTNGSRYAARFNTITQSGSAAGSPLFNFHGSSDDTNSCMGVEIYKNTITAGSGTTYLLQQRGGMAMVFDNSLSRSGTSIGLIQVGDYADDCSTDACDNDWTYPNSPDGQPQYPSSSYYFNNIITSWSGEKKWGEMCTSDYSNSGGGDHNCAVLDPPNRVVPVADYEFWGQYPQAGDSLESFTGARGVGRGLWAARPGTCTEGVGYWATDKGEWNSESVGNDGALYVCNDANTFEVYYTPYTYPHRLRDAAAAPANSIQGVSISELKVTDNLTAWNRTDGLR